MRKLRTLTGLALLISAATFAWAGDTVKINRSIAKEPVYQSKAPKYCLLTFGREGKTRVWLVFDSVPNPLVPGKDKDYLYVDRNGNGDLTESGERIEATVHQVPDGVFLGGVPPGTIPLLEFPIGE